MIEFTLRPGIMFQGGYGEMTAEDVKFSFEQFGIAVKDGKKSTYASDWSALKEVEVTGKYAGKIHLKNAAPALWNISIADGNGNILSKKAVEALGDKIATQMVGSGPYMIEKWTPNQELVLVRNPTYKGAEPAKIPRVIIKPVAEAKTAEIALRAKEIDFTPISPASIDALKGVAGVSVIEKPGMRYLFIGINVDKKPFDNIKVRQAVRAALDVNEIVAAGYDGKVKRANAMLQPSLIGYWQDAPNRKRDVALAKKLLAEAGLASGFKAQITVLNQAHFKTMALVAQANLADVGIQLDVDARDGGAFWGLGKDDLSKNLDMSLQPYSAKSDPGFSSQWFTSAQVGQWNWQRYKSAEYDRLHEQANASTDVAARARMYIEMQKIMDEFSAYVWLTHDASVFACASWLKPAVLPNGTDWQYSSFAEG